MILAMILAPAFGNSSQERPRSLSGPLLPGPETRSLLRGCRYVSRPHGALKRETGASFKSLCFSWRTVKAFRQSEVAAVCDLVGDRLALRSYRSLPGGTVEEASGVRRTARNSPPIFSVSPPGAAQAPAAGGRASDAHSGSPQRVTPPLHRETSL